VQYAFLGVFLSSGDLRVWIFHLYHAAIGDR